jgi:hypothetical protein
MDGSALINPYLTIKPDKPDIELRSKLLEFFLENYRGQELSDWLRDIGQDNRGTAEEKRARLRQTTTYLTTPLQEFPAETMAHLNSFPSEYLAGLCEVLDIDSGGTRDMRYRRIIREIGYREGWLSRLESITEATFRLATIQPYVEWYPIIKRGSYEKDFYQAFVEEMEEIFGNEFVHKELAIAFGSTLKVDFHLGHPQREGVGVEFKMPTNNSEIQRALGQLDQYKQRYRDNMLIVLFPDFLDTARKILFRDQVSAKGIAVVIK